MFRSKGVVTTIAILGLFAFSVAGCGGDDGASEEQLQQAREDGAKEAEAQMKLDRLEAQVKQLRKSGKKSKKAKSSGGNSSSAAPASSSSGGTSYTQCGGGVGAGSSTSCEFAMNVAGEYGSNPGASSIMAYSPVTDTFYTMSCSPSGSGTVCSGGNGASVFVP